MNQRRYFAGNQILNDAGLSARRICGLGTLERHVRRIAANGLGQHVNPSGELHHNRAENLVSFLVYPPVQMGPNQSQSREPEKPH